MPYNIYQDGELIAEGIEEKEYIVEGLTPNTEYSFSVSEVIGENESEQSDPVTITTIYSDVESVAVSPKTNNLIVGATRQLNVTVEPSTAKQDVTYSSTNNEIATVDTNGLVTAISVGQVTITVTTENETDTSIVNVTEPEEGD
ncbi:Ig-like domain-containing protein [Ornithinibacillus sp. 4-3]|uniref:Ig-like domain-containing protein n=1 Tax=Ornithinibacillus sp. 4-3 TaxID=3231488 RepID=A0AB39HN18_9BACI